MLSILLTFYWFPVFVLCISAYVTMKSEVDSIYSPIISPTFDWFSSLGITLSSRGVLFKHFSFGSFSLFSLFGSFSFLSFSSRLPVTKRWNKSNSAKFIKHSTFFRYHSCPTTTMLTIDMLWKSIDVIGAFTRMIKISYHYVIVNTFVPFTIYKLGFKC